MWTYFTAGIQGLSPWLTVSFPSHYWEGGMHMELLAAFFLLAYFLCGFLPS
jgi:hypothetical protein